MQVSELPAECLEALQGRKSVSRAVGMVASQLRQEELNRLASESDPAKVPFRQGILRGFETLAAQITELGEAEKE